MPRLQLILRGPNIPGIPDVEMDLRNPDWSIFKAVQQCVQSSGIGSKADKIRRVWEPTYVIVYKEAKEKSPSGTYLKKYLITNAIIRFRTVVNKIHNLNSLCC